MAQVQREVTVERLRLTAAFVQAHVSADSTTSLPADTRMEWLPNSIISRAELRTWAERPGGVAI